MDQAADAILQAAGEDGSLDELSDVEVDADGSSSLSEIEDKDGEQDEDPEASDGLSDVSDGENDSEAETERLEESPNKFRLHQDVVLSSQINNQTYERSPSKLNKQITTDDHEEDEEEEPLSDDEISVDESPESPKSPALDEPEIEPPTAATSLQDSSGEGKTSLSVMDPDTKKRKRSIMAGGVVDEDIEEPLRKRTGSVLTPGDDYAIEDDINPEEEVDNSNPISGDVSGDEVEPAHEEEVVEDIEEPVADDEIVPTISDALLLSPKKRGRRKKKGQENGVDSHEDAEAGADGEAVLNGDLEVRNGDEDHADNEGDDEAEAALKNEEELEKKRVALEQLTTIERQFTTFRDRLYDERLEQLNREEAMLRQDKPTHPEYLAMMECIDARRDARIRVADNLKKLEMESLRRTAVARRSQILTQYQQDVRMIRETKLHQLGEQWYKIQHDRRSYAGSVPDYALKFPTRRSQQIHNQVAYSNEVSILSGIAKYVGFPAAPRMAAATAAELEDDFEKMGRIKQAQQVQPPGLPLQELAALRTAGSIARSKPAVDQFVSATPWANPQHPSHAHLLQRQTSAQQTPRTTSPLSQVQVQPRRHSHQHGSSVPISGTFPPTPAALLHHSSNGASMSGGRISPHNPFGNSNHVHSIAPSPLGSRQTSLSPQQNRHPISIPEQQHNLLPTQDIPKSNGAQHSPPIGHSEGPRDFSHEVRREAASSMMSRF